jgi:hypothetical protein
VGPVRGGKRDLGAGPGDQERVHRISQCPRYEMPDTAAATAARNPPATTVPKSSCIASPPLPDASRQGRS